MWCTQGNETSLAECTFSGWGVSNCSPEETAGVRCLEGGVRCKENQWKCESTGACIPIEFLCDKVEDCGDGSDENRTRCHADLLVRLADGPDAMTGRVEIRYSDIWGSICDDDFGDDDAAVLCRMLDYHGPAKVMPSNMFGPGSGPIWLDELGMQLNKQRNCQLLLLLLFDAIISIYGASGCSGTENTLLECSRLPWAKHNCKETEHVGIKCSKMVEREETTSPMPMVRPKGLPDACGHRWFGDTPADPLGNAIARIVEGKPTKHGAHPWQVGLRVKGRGRIDSIHWCGASIISEFFIITAAHCLRDFDKGTYVLRVGDYNTQVIDEHFRFLSGCGIQCQHFFRFRILILKRTSSPSTVSICTKSSTGKLTWITTSPWFESKRTARAAFNSVNMSNLFACRHWTPNIRPV